MPQEETCLHFQATYYANILKKALWRKQAVNAFEDVQKYEWFVENRTSRITPGRKHQASYVWITMCLNSMSVFSKAKQGPQVSGLEDSFRQRAASSQFVEYSSLWANIDGWQWLWTRTGSTTAKKRGFYQNSWNDIFHWGKLKELRGNFWII